MPEQDEAFRKVIRDHIGGDPAMVDAVVQAHNAALRAARDEALEEAAKEAKALCGYCPCPQGCGYRCKISAAIRKLKEKSRE